MKPGPKISLGKVGHDGESSREKKPLSLHGFLVFLLVFLVTFAIGIPSVARHEHGGGDFQAMRQRVQKIGTWRSENRTCCVAGAGREWKILVFGSKNQTQILKSRIFFL